MTEDFNLHILRQKALRSTQKRKATSHLTQQYMASHKERKSSPARVVDSYPRTKGEKRSHPSSIERVDAKHLRRASSASTSHSSYSSYSHSPSPIPRHSRSHSYSTSRSSSASRSHNVSSRSSSYSGSRSGSYSHSSVSGSLSSGRTRSPSPVSRTVSKKSHLLSSNYQEKVEPYHSKGSTDRHRARPVSPDIARKSASYHREYRTRSPVTRGGGSTFYPLERSRTGERRSRHVAAIPLSSDSYYRGSDSKEADSRHKSFPLPPPVLSKRPRFSSYLDNDDAYLKSTSRHRHDRLPMSHVPSSLHRSTLHSPRHHQERPLPNHQERSIPNRQERLIPNRQDRFLPNRQERSLPNRQERSLPNRQERSLPNRQERSLPNRQERSLPNRQDRHLPNRLERPLPNRQERSLPNRQERFLPNRQERSFPNRQERSLPNRQERSLPNRQERSLPNRQERSLPNRQERSLPDCQERSTRHCQERSLPPRERRVVRQSPPPLATSSRDDSFRYHSSPQWSTITSSYTHSQQQPLSSSQINRKSGGLRSPERTVNRSQLRSSQGDSRSERRREDVVSSSRYEERERTERDIRSVKLDQSSNGIPTLSSTRRHCKHSSSDRSDEEYGNVSKRWHEPELEETSLVAKNGRSHRRDRKRKKKGTESSSILSVLDSVSPKKKDTTKEEESLLQPTSDDDSDSKTADRDISERDLLGDYEFNPFVDVELDYDENMEEGNEQSESQTMGMKKDEQEGEVEKEPMESNLMESNLMESNLMESNLMESNLMEPNLMEPNLMESNLMESNLMESNLMEPNLMEPNLMEPNLMEPNLMEPNLMEPNLMEPNLMESNLMESNLSGEVKSESSVREEPVEIPPEDVSCESDPELDEEDDKGAAISSPIRVTPDRKLERERKKVSSSKWRGEKGRTSKTLASANKLSIKERLFVSRKAIEEKKNALGRKNTDSLRPSLANRLGPSPSTRHRRSVSTSGGNNKRYGSGGGTGGRGNRINLPSKGSALEIAEAYKMKKREENRHLLRDDERHKAKKLTKMINSSHDHGKASGRHLSPLPSSVDKEKALDQRINFIHQRNKDLERRKREVEQDKRLYG